MTNLIDKKCVPCEGDMQPFNQSEAEALMKEVSDGWNLVEYKRLEREFGLANFAEALKFINDVGAIAESEGHHPDIFLHNWNKVKLTLSTHAIGGLSENDFILAAKIDALLPAKN